MSSPVCPRAQRLSVCWWLQRRRNVHAARSDQRQRAKTTVAICCFGRQAALREFSNRARSSRRTKPGLLCKLASHVPICRIWSCWPSFDRLIGPSAAQTLLQQTPPLSDHSERSTLTAAAVPAAHQTSRPRSSRVAGRHWYRFIDLAAAVDAASAFAADAPASLPPGHTQGTPVGSLSRRDRLNVASNKRQDTTAAFYPRGVPDGVASCVPLTAHDGHTGRPRTFVMAVRNRCHTRPPRMTSTAGASQQL